MPIPAVPSTYRRRSAGVIGRLTFAVLLIGTGVAAGEPEAQLTAQGGYSSSLRTLSTEAGAYIGVWNLMDGGGTFGLRYTRKRSEWMAFEGEVTVRWPQSGLPRARLVVGHVRVGVQDPDREGRLVFLTVGLAAGRSHHFSLSPVIGAGYQSRHPTGVGTRIDLQVFRDGRGVLDRSRLIGGIFVAW